MKLTIVTLVLLMQGAMSDINGQAEVRLAAGSASIVQANDIYTLCVQLENISSAMQQTIYGRLGWGESHGLRLEILDSKGHRVPKSRLDHYRVIPSTFDNPDYYISLQPKHFIGICRNDPAADIFPAPGKYTVKVSYRSPVPEKLSDKKLALYYEDNWISADALEVVVIE